MMIDNGLDEAIARLPERYQPIYGRDDVEAKRDADLPRTARILAMIDFINGALGRPLRILDLGSAQGYYSFLAAERGHKVTGVENLAANVEVARGLAAEHPHLDVDFVEADIVDVGMGVEVGDFDVVLGLSILHHLAHSGGHAAAVALVSHLSSAIPFGVFEMALCNEPLYWASSLPSDPRATLASFPFIRELVWSHTHLSDIERPLLFCSSTHVLVNDELRPIMRYSEASHPGAASVLAGKRRYFEVEGGIVKVAAHFGEFDDISLLGEIRDEMRREVAVIEELRDTDFELPDVIEFHDSPDEVLVAKTIFPGVLLSEVLSELADDDRHDIFHQTLQQLAALEGLGRYHTDLRAWNVIWNAETRKSMLIDQGAISRQPSDAAWPFDAYYSFVIFSVALWTGEADQLGLDSPRAFALDTAKLPARVANVLMNAVTRPAGDDFFRTTLADWADLADSQDPPSVPVTVSWASKLGAMLTEDYGSRKKTAESLARTNRHHKAERDALLKERTALWSERDELWNERTGLYVERDNSYAERDKLYAERDELYADRDRLYAERDDLYEQREALYQERQALSDELQQGLVAQAALVTAQELALQGFARDYDHMLATEAKMRQIEQSLTWRAHRAVAGFALTRVVARSTRRVAKKLRR